MASHRVSGVTLVRLLVILVGLLVLSVIGGLLALRVAVHVGDDEGVGQAAADHPPVRGRPVHPLDTGRLVAPFVTRAAEASPGGWVLLDGSSGEVLLLDPRGTPEGRFGRRGEGPGELERPASAIRSGDGTVLVLDAFTRHIDVFPPGGDPWRRRIEPGGCPVGRAEAFHSAPALGWIVVRTCMSGMTRTLEAAVIAPDGLQKTVPLGPLPSAVQDLFAQPVALVADGLLHVGSNRRTCLTRVDLDAGALSSDHRCLPSPAPFATPDSIVQASLGRSLNRLADAGLKAVLPETFPTLVDARPTERGVAVRIVLEDLSEVWAVEEGGELVYAEADDEIRVHPGWDAWLLLRDEITGLRIWTVPYSTWGDPP